MKPIANRRFFKISLYLTYALISSCNKDNVIKKPTGDEPIGNVSYIADGLSKNHEIFDEAPYAYAFRKIGEYLPNSDTPICYYYCYFPFSSPKTKNGIAFYMGNDSLIVAQRYTKKNRILYPTLDPKNSNSLDVLIATAENNKPSDNWYHEGLDFQLTIDSIINNHAFGHFDGNVFYYQLDEHGIPAVVTDSIEITKGLFYNIPIIDTF